MQCRTLPFLIPVLYSTICLGATPWALSEATISGNAGRVEAQLKVTPGELNQIDKWGWTPLLWSVYYDYLPVTKCLLDHGADPDVQVAKAYRYVEPGTTPLIIAARYGLDAQAEALLARGAKLGTADHRGMTAAEYAKKMNFPAVSDLLAKEKAKANEVSLDPEP